MNSGRIIFKDKEGLHITAKLRVSLQGGIMNLYEPNYIALNLDSGIYIYANISLKQFKPFS